MDSSYPVAGTGTQGGFSLVELVVVMAIFGTVLAIATLSFNGWQVKSNAEAQVRAMFNDLSELRLRAMTRNQRHSVTVNATGYVFKSYSSDAEPAGAGTVVSGGNSKLAFRLMKNGTLPYGGDVFDFDSRGMLQSGSAAIYLDVPAKNTAALDCLSVQAARVSPGKKNTTGDACDVR